jgi:hypothetical protein
MIVVITGSVPGLKARNDGNLAIETLGGTLRVGVTAHQPRRHRRRPTTWTLSTRCSPDCPRLNRVARPPTGAGPRG